MNTVESTAPRPLDGFLVLDFSQFLAGPVAAVRLADLGARVIKIERPRTGELGRSLAFAGVVSDGDTLSFHIANRGKEGMSADLKDAGDLAAVKALIAEADVLIQNFRPGVMERIGLDPASVAEINPRLVYGSVSGYGPEGPWRDLPGQDLLAQSVAGLPWLNGSREHGPVPVGLSVADLLASIHLAHGITALLLRRERTGLGGLVETSLIEGVLDLQFELLSARLNDASVTVQRGGEHSASAFLPAPYGVYPTADGHLSLAMNSVPRIGRLIGLDLEQYADPDSWWSARDEIEAALAGHLSTRATEHWLSVLQAADVWCAPVLTLGQLIDSDGFAAVDMTQVVTRPAGGGGGGVHELRTTRSPLRVDGQVLRSGRGAPRLGEHDAALRAEFGPSRDSASVAAGERRS